MIISERINRGKQANWRCQRLKIGALASSLVLGTIVVSSRPLCRACGRSPGHPTRGLRPDDAGSDLRHASGQSVAAQW